MKKSKKEKMYVDENDIGIKGIQRNLEPDWNNRVLVFTPTRGTVRMEWVNARYGQIIPTNWSHVDMYQFLTPFVPIQYQLADAQNLMAKKVIEDDYEWIIYIEDDNVLPPDAFMRFNKYMREKKEPVVSALYFTKTNDPEPILYRGRGNSYYGDWKIGDLVRVDGIPFGFRLEHASLIKEAWKNSPEYMVAGQLTRRVFDSPGRMWFDEDKGGMVSKKGTTDLAWCSRIMEEGLFEKAGWSEHQKMQYPFLVDTNILVRHIDHNGVMYPKSIPQQFLPDNK